MEYSTQDQIQQIKNEFYTQNKKNVLFKTDQKFHLAQSVCNQIDIEDLLHNTCWIIPHTNKVYFEYSVFKHYACPENYSYIVNRVHNLCLECVETYKSFEVHVNLASFSMSAAERYKSVIQMYSEHSSLTEYLDKLCLYNVPAMIDNISRLLSPMVPPEVRSKRQLFSKEVSHDLLQSLHHSGSVALAEA